MPTSRTTIEKTWTGLAVKPGDELTFRGQKLCPFILRGSCGSSCLSGLAPKSIKLTLVVYKYLNMQHCSDCHKWEGSSLHYIVNKIYSNAFIRCILSLLPPTCIIPHTSASVHVRVWRPVLVQLKHCIKTS